MDYRVLWKDENEAVKERYYLAMDRISQITRESTVEEPYRSYFIKTAEFIQMISEVKSLVDADAWNSQSLEELKLWNERMLERCHTVHPELSRRAAGMRSGLQVRQGFSPGSARCLHRRS